MDKKIIEIFKLVREINRKGGNLALNLSPRGIEIMDQSNGFKSILPEYDTIYFGSYWKNKYKNMIEDALKVLRDRLKDQSKTIEINREQ